MGDAIFKIPTAAMLSKIVDGIDRLELGDADTKGDLYEFLLSRLQHQEPTDSSEPPDRL